MKRLFQLRWLTAFWRGESALLHRNGYELPVSQCIVAHKDENGHPKFLSTIMREISSDKTRAEQLKLLEHAFNHIGEAVYLISRHAQLIQVNKEACRLLGYDQQELLTLSLEDIAPDFNTQVWTDFCRTAQNQALSKTFETTLRCQSGVLLPVEVNLNHIIYHDQPFIMALVRDISERKRMENLLILREREFRTLADSLPDPLCRYDCETRRTYINPAWLKSGGIIDDVLGKTF
ncbi:PAS domain-containing protein [Methylocucumis oryzae]|uniref:PAS domain-containing protein n=1 Tax=Methylocucumis oryzae TaxID=1632867 RepID=A0A0F3IP18_9GAMM|nr:PAS domain S-box protein [Methylocucumis oryzae]KJV07329.1 hypothetical protein VZ94_05350 [Methylocucumis oryzae]